MNFSWDYEVQMNWWAILPVCGFNLAECEDCGETNAIQWHFGWLNFEIVFAVDWSAHE